MCVHIQMWNQEYSKLNWRAANVCVEGGWNSRKQWLLKCTREEHPRLPGLGADDDAKGKRRPRADEARLRPFFLRLPPFPFLPCFPSSICPSSQFPLLITRTSDSRTSQANLVVMAVRSLCVVAFFSPPLLVPCWYPFGAVSCLPGGGMGRVELD